MNKDIDSFDKIAIDNGIGSDSGLGSETLINSKPNPNPVPDNGSNSSNTGDDTRAGGDAIDFNPDGWYDSNTWNKNALIEMLTRFGLSQERAEYEAQRIANNLVYTGNDIPIFSPDPNASPADNLANLSAWLSYAIGAYEVNNELGFDKSFNFANQLIRIYTALSNSGNHLIEDLSDAATLELSEKICDQLFSFINTQFNAVMSYQSWYLQQEYNSPINQVDRLAKAGLSSAFVVGSSLGSGNAQSAASMPQMQQPAASNAGQAEAQAQANKGNFITSLLGAIGSVAGVVSKPLEIYKGVLEADAIKRLTPLQLSKASADVLNSAATYEKLLNENTALRQSIQFQESQLQIQASQSSLDNQAKTVELAKGAADTYFERNAVEFRNIGYSTHVKDKSGNTVRKVYDLDGMKYINEHNGKDMEGNQVVDSKYYKRNHNVNANAGVNWGVPGMGGGNVDIAYGFAFESQNAHSNTSNKTHEKGYSNSSQNQQDHSEGKDTSNSWRIGDTEFKQEITVKRVLPNQYKDEFDRLQSTYENALKTFNSMSDKHKSLMLQIKSCQDFNFGNQSKINVMKAYRKLLNNTFNTDNIDKTLEGD